MEKLLSEINSIIQEPRKGKGNDKLKKVTFSEYIQEKTISTLQESSMHNAMSDLDMSVDSIQERNSEHSVGQNTTIEMNGSPTDPPSSLFDDCEDSIQETPRPNKVYDILETPKASAIKDPFVDDQGAF